MNDEKMLADALLLCANVLLTAVQGEIKGTPLKAANFVPAERVAVFALKHAGYEVELTTTGYSFPKDTA